MSEFVQVIQPIEHLLIVLVECFYPIFNVSRTLKVQANDSSRLQKYLAKFGLKWGDIK